MLATLTSKGQLTLPKEIRERFGLVAGSRLDFSVDAGGMIVARPMAATALGLSLALTWCAADMLDAIHVPMGCVRGDGRVGRTLHGRRPVRFS